MTTPLALSRSAGCLHAGRHVGAHVIDGGAGLVGDELVGLEIDAVLFRRGGVEPGGAGEIAEHGAVLGRDLADILIADQPARALHVLHDDRGLPLDMLADVAREQPALDVGRPAGGEVDQRGEALAFVEGIVGAALAGRRAPRRKHPASRLAAAASAFPVRRGCVAPATIHALPAPGQCGLLRGMVGRGARSVSPGVLALLGEPRRMTAAESQHARGSAKSRVALRCSAQKRRAPQG